MPSARETRLVPYSPQQMFDLVGDIRRYPEFLPWCSALRVRSDEVSGEGVRVLISDMLVRYKGFEERFTSRAHLIAPEMCVRTEFVDGSFEHLENRWHFHAGENGGTAVEFFIDFRFRSRILQKLASSMFEKALMKLSDAFVQRAHALYGDAKGDAGSG